MSNEHIVQLPKAVWGIKIVQTIIAVLVLGFSAFELAVIPNGYSGFSIFAAIFSGGSLIYYFVAIHGNKKIYNWIALLVLECLSLIWWLVVWALLAALLALAAAYASYYDYYDGYYYKRDLVKRVDTSTATAAGVLLYVTLALGLVQWILYCVTLGFISVGIHRHRKAGKPMSYGRSSNTAWDSAPREEKHEREPVPAAPAYSNNAAPAYGNHAAQAPAAAPMQYDQQPNLASGHEANPIPPNTHEAYGSSRYT